MSPYSIPLCTIFTKWPAPLPPQWRYPCSPAVGSPAPPPAARRGVDPRRQRREDRLQPGERLLVAADHQAEPALQPEDPTARPDVEVVDPARLELARAPDVVGVVGVAAVDDRVAGLELGGHFP